MIRTPKGQKPHILQINGNKWNREYCIKLRAWKKNKVGPKPVPYYNHHEIKDALERDFHGKCAYCESKIMYQQHGDIEHFRPKERFCHLIHDWDNLLLSCDRCNTKKRAQFPNPQIINPMDENPENIFEYEKIGNIINIKSQYVRGQISISTIGLNHERITGQRKESLQQAEALICLIENKFSQTFRDAIGNYTNNSSEFTGMFRYFLREFTS